MRQTENTGGQKSTQPRRNSSLSRLRRALQMHQRSLLVKCYQLRKLIQKVPPLTHLTASEVLFDSVRSHEPDHWVFHDEDWVRVIHRREHRRLVAAGQPLNVLDNRQKPTQEVAFLEDGTIRFTGRTETKDEWLYLYLDPAEYAWSDYVWKFRIRRDTHFREFQFGFRYRDFYNRYRYRFENDYIYLDKVVKGQFYNGYGSVPFRMELGVWYDVEIRVWKNRFECCIDGALLLTDCDSANHFPTGSIAIILWEDDGATDLSAAIGPIRVSALVPPETNGPGRA